MSTMSGRNHPGRVLVLAITTTLVALISSCGGKGTTGFQERAQAAGIAFRMNNLPREQGERFRINLYDHGSGLAVGDYDNDGRDDIYFLNQHGTNALYHNVGKGSFVDVTAKAGVALGDRISVAATFADYDNDGFADLFVTSTRGGNILFHNRGDGTFVDVTSAAGVSHTGHSQTPVFFDYDNDGDLDLYLTNTAHWTTDVFDFASGNYEGKASLADMMTGLDYQQLSRETATQNQHRRFLTPSGPTVNENAPGFMLDQRASFATQGENYDDLLFGNALYRNLGQGKFTETALTAGLETFWPWGIATGDYDNDGNEDVFITSGMGYPIYYWPNQLMMNNGDGTFRDRASDLGVEPPTGGIYQEKDIAGHRASRSSRSAAVGEFDCDSPLDILTHHIQQPAPFFANAFPRHNYVALRLTGVTSNRDAIGALVRLWSGRKVMVQQVSPAGGYLAQSSRVLHFGLADRSHVDSITIRWPRGIAQTLKSPKVDTLLQIREPAQ